MSNGSLSKPRKIMAALLLLPLGIIIPFLSLESNHTAPISAQATDSALAARVKKYKAAYKERIETSEEKKISIRCAVAQTRAKAMATRFDSIEKTRIEGYDAILKKLNDLRARLEEQAFETTKIDENIATLTEKVTDFKGYMKDYTQAVSDLSVIDCEKDPAAYIAAIKYARNNHAKLLPLVGDIRTYITNTVQPNLRQIRNQIESGQTTGGALR